MSKLLASGGPSVLACVVVDEIEGKTFSVVEVEVALEFIFTEEETVVVDGSCEENGRVDNILVVDEGDCEDK
jgi:hypothetical protein